MVWDHVVSQKLIFYNFLPVKFLDIKMRFNKIQPAFILGADGVTAFGFVG